MGEWGLGYPVNFTPTGDTTSQAIEKHINELNQIYGYLNRIRKLDSGINAPTDPIQDHLWLDTSNGMPILRRYDATAGTWVPVDRLTESLSDVISTIGSDNVRLSISSTIDVPTDITIPSNVFIDFVYPGKFNVQTQTITGENVGTGDGTTTVFNLQETPILEGSDTIYVDGTAQTRNTDYTINYDTGQITFTTAPASSAVITADYIHQYVLTLNCGFRAGLWQIFDGDGVVTGSPKIEAVYPEWFGAKGDGVTDDTDAIQKTVKLANGRTVKFGYNVYNITTNIDEGYDGEIRISGSGESFYTHIGSNDTTSFDDDYSNYSNKITVIKCTSCSFIGKPDTTTTANYNSNLKFLENMIIYAVNGDDQIGIHIHPVDTIIQNCFIANFGLFGLLTRSGITSTFKNIGFRANGWNLSESGTIGTDYGSGCNLKINSDITPQNYHTINSSYRPTTFTLKDIYISSNNTYNGATYSGLRAIQAHGLIDASFINVGSYQGWCFQFCDVTLDSCHIENYAESGTLANDNTPIELYLYSSGTTLNNCYIVNLGTNATSSRGIVNKSLSQYTNGLVNLRSGIISSTIPYIKNIYSEITSPAATATTLTHSFDNIFGDETFEGFQGLIYITLQKKVDYKDYSQAIYPLSRFSVSDTVYTRTGTSLDNFDSGSGTTWQKTISAVRANGNNLEIDVDWGSSWNNEVFRASITLIGNCIYN